MNNIKDEVHLALRAYIKRLAQILPSAVILLAFSSCVNIATPDEPIVINLNIKIEQEITVKDAEAVEEAIEDNAGIF